MRDLDCIAGTSKLGNLVGAKQLAICRAFEVESSARNLKKLGMPQGLIIFGSLQVLKLKKNQLPHLRVLQFAGLTERGRSSFSLKLPAIRELDLSYNLLEAIPNLEGLPKLEVLLLDHNRINGPLLEVSSARVRGSDHISEWVSDGLRGAEKARFIEQSAGS